MTTKTKKTKKAVAKPTAKRGVKSTAKAVARPAKKIIAKARSIGKRMEKPVTRQAKKITTKAKPIAKRAEKTAAKPEVNLMAKSEAVTVVTQVSRSVSAEPAKLLHRPPVTKAKTKVKVRQTHGSSPGAEARRTLRLARMPQYAYMKAPGADHAYEVGDTVEVFCDHEKNKDRIRGWVKGIVVQVDNKLVAVQFRSNVYLTDGWMVPDRILWFPIISDQIRTETFAKKGNKKDIPDY